MAHSQGSLLCSLGRPLVSYSLGQPENTMARTVVRSGRRERSVVSKTFGGSLPFLND